MSILTVREVSKRYGKTVGQVKYAFSKGYIPGARKLNEWSWIIEEKDLPQEWPITGRGRKKRG